MERGPSLDLKNCSRSSSSSVDASLDEAKLVVVIRPLLGTGTRLELLVGGKLAEGGLLDKAVVVKGELWDTAAKALR